MALSIKGTPLDFTSWKIEVKVMNVVPTVKKIHGPIKHDFDVKSFKSGIKSPLGVLLIIVDELVRNQPSYFLKERVGLLKSKAMPVLFKDERPEFLLNVSTGRFRKVPLLFTGRRLLMAFDGFVQSKWVKPAFQGLFSLLGVKYWKEGLLKEKRYDGLSVNFRFRRVFPLKYVEIGWIKHVYQDGWAGRVYNPISYTPYERKVKTEDLLNILLDKARKAVKTDVLDLIALEDFCLTENLEIYKVGFHGFGSSKLKSGEVKFREKEAFLISRTSLNQEEHRTDSGFKLMEDKSQPIIDVE